MWRKVFAVSKILEMLMTFLKVIENTDIFWSPFKYIIDKWMMALMWIKNGMDFSYSWLISFLNYWYDERDHFVTSDKIEEVKKAIKDRFLEFSTITKTKRCCNLLDSFLCISWRHSLAAFNCLSYFIDFGECWTEPFIWLLRVFCSLLYNYLAWCLEKHVQKITQKKKSHSLIGTENMGLQNNLKRVWLEYWLVKSN